MNLTDAGRYGEELPTKNGAAELESRRNDKCHPRGHGRRNGLFSSFSGLQCSTNNADRQGEDCSKKCTFTSENTKKRLDRLYGFLARRPEIKFRASEKTSLARAKGLMEGNFMIY
ncbi:hypothetical protein J437_LFUL017652 [Ladona fulva]|uniref:Uncharacterized protein n=1 Tax=Ladona fulva TaxID=123851 RepID=A0A8K0KN25_LADFU|nr:hypothetical protein J437_LFUL017652 [Ladona fulva]